MIYYIKTFLQIASFSEYIVNLYLHSQQLSVYILYFNNQWLSMSFSKSCVGLYQNSS